MNREYYQAKQPLSVYMTKMLCIYITFDKPEQTLKHNQLWGQNSQKNGEYKYFVLIMTHFVLNFNTAED